jgi:hypothetical protein
MREHEGGGRAEIVAAGMGGGRQQGDAGRAEKAGREDEKTLHRWATPVGFVSGCR